MSNEDRVRKIASMYKQSSKAMKILIGHVLAGDIRTR